MGTQRFAFLDPEGTAKDWLHVVVQARTGVVYQQQYGGTACRQGQVEGFLVPLSAAGALGELRRLFESDLRGAGAWNYPWPDEQRERLRQIINGISYWACDGHSEQPHPLRLDDSRIHEPTRHGCR